MKRNYLFWLLLPLGILFLFFLIRGINTPYVGPNATNYNWYSLIAHNYVQFGFIQTKFLQILSPIKSLHDPMRVYLHHPPLISIFEAISFLIFGEHFWSGRLVVILFSLGSSTLLFFIGKISKSTQFGAIAFLISCLIPATSIFGQMVGQESLVLFFVLLTVYATLLYQQKQPNKLLVLLAIVSVVLGTFSDWPMVYFTITLLPYLFFIKQKKLGLALVLASSICAVSFVFYTFTYSHGLSDLGSAFTTRSLGVLLSQSYWPIKWVSILTVRFFLYFNPIIVIFAFIYLGSLLRKNRTPEFFLIMSFFIFGAIHILLYPEGSFGHPYWTYYMLPFFVYGSAEVTQIVLNKKRYVQLALIFIFSLIWLWKVEDWKTKQIDANLWRYDLFEKTEKLLSPRESIAVNPDSAIDSDLIEYIGLHQVRISDIQKIHSTPYTLQHYVLSCTGVCSMKDKTFVAAYQWHHIKNTGGETYIVDVRTVNKLQLSKIQPFVVPSHSSKPSDTGIESLYRQIKDLLHAPQL